MEVLEIIIVEIWANPTHVMGWFNAKLRRHGVHLSTKRSGCKGGDFTTNEQDLGGDSKPVVGLPVRQATSGGETSDYMGYATPDFPKSDNMRGKPTRVLDREKNVGDNANFHQHHE